jgi:hypothetical protein
MVGAFQCGEILSGVFDHYINTNKANVTQINNRQLPVLFPNITKMVNDAEIPSIMGNTYKLDRNGDLILDMTIIIYRDNISYSGSPLQPLQPVVVGKWSVDSELLTLDESNVFFLGNKTTPPLPFAAKVPPNIDYNYKSYLRIIIDVLASLCCLFTFVLLCYTIRFIDAKVIKSSSPVFLIVILFGANVSFAGIYVLSLIPLVCKMIRCDLIFI